MKALLAIGCATTALVVAGAGTSASVGTASCTAGVTTVGGASARTFCGPAKASVTIGGKTLRFTNGTCEKLSGYYSVNIGSITLPPAKPKYMYFGFTTTKKRGGTYKVYGDVTLGWQTPGKSYSLGKGSVRISSSMKGGTFSGTTLLNPQKTSGSWTC